MDYSAAIDYLLSFTDMERGVQRSDSPAMSLASMRSLLARLNDPHLDRPTVHVTGSKGKGSTSAMIASILHREGHSTSLFTSPHLHSFTERISIDGDSVSPAEFAAAIEAIRPAVDAEQESVHGNVSTHGVLTALFFWLTRAQVPRVDWQVVEVGLGGTFDSTNVFETVDVAVITSISLEHTEILGDTPAEIATDKAGIVKPGSTCVLAAQRDPAVVDVVRARCDDVGASLVYVPEKYEAEVIERHVFGQSFRLRGPRGVRELRMSLLGEHQVQNAATAAAVADALRARGHHITEGSIADGIAYTRVPGRLEVMGQRPLLVADGAHNGESAEALASALRAYFDWRHLYLILGVLRGKDLGGIGAHLAGLAELVICTALRSPRARDPYEMIQELGVLGPPAVAEDSMQAAIETALSHAGEEDLVCIAGSLYGVAEAREIILGEGATGA